MSINQLKFLTVFLSSFGLMASNAQGVLTKPSGSSIRVKKQVLVRISRYGSSLDLNTTPEEQEVIGSPYLVDDFSEGTLFLRTGDNYNLQMRYNIYDDRIEYKERDSVFSIEPDPAIEKAVVGPQTLVVDTCEVKGRKLLAYFSLLDSGKLRLFAKMSIVFWDSEVKALEGAKPAKYERVKDEYYYKVGNGRPLTKINRISNLINELPDHRQEMEEYVKKEKISSNKSGELTKFTR